MSVGGPVFLGVDIGATHLRGVLLYPLRRSASGLRIATPPPEGLAEALSVLTSTVSVRPAQLVAVGLSRAAAVDGGGRVSAWPSRSDYLGADLLEPLIRTVGEAAVVRQLDDGMAAAFGEAVIAGAEGDGLCVLSLGTGLGVGLVVDGRLVDTGEGADTLGHLPLGLAQRLCVCGRMGCLQATVVDPVAADADVSSALLQMRNWLIGRYGISRVIVTGGGAAARRGVLAGLKDFRISATPHYSAAFGAAAYVLADGDIAAARQGLGGISLDSLCI